MDQIYDWINQSILVNLLEILYLANIYWLNYVYYDTSIVSFLIWAHFNIGILVGIWLIHRGLPYNIGYQGTTWHRVTIIWACNLTFWVGSVILSLFLMNIDCCQLKLGAIFMSLLMILLIIEYVAMYALHQNIRNFSNNESYLPENTKLAI